MIKTFRPRRRSAAAFVGLAMASLAAAPSALAQQADQTVDTVHVATADELFGALHAPTGWEPLQAPINVPVVVQGENNKPPPDPCTFLTIQALRIAQSCNGEVTMPSPDLQSRLPLLGDTRTSSQPSFDVSQTDADIALLLAPRAYSRPQTILPTGDADDVVVVTATRLLPSHGISDAYYADLERRFGQTGLNASYREFEDWLASGTGRTVSALGLGFLRNMAEDEMRDQLQDLIVGGAEGADFSMDPIGDRNDAWMRETFLRQRGINPDERRRPH